jgi:hypothetical protein
VLTSQTSQFIIMISDANLNLVVSCTIIIIAIVPVWKEIYLRSKSKHFAQRFTHVGILLLCAAFAFIVFNYYKDTNNEKKINSANILKNKSDSLSGVFHDMSDSFENLLLKKQESLSVLEITMRDSILKKVDSVYARSIRASNIALAKYHLKIIDSLHTVVGNLKLNSLNPQLLLAPISNHQTVFIDKQNEDTVLKIQLVSANATSYNIHLNLDYLLANERSDTYLGRIPVLNGDVFISPGSTKTVFVALPEAILGQKKIHFILWGSFSKDTEGKDTISYHEAFQFNVAENKFLQKEEINFEAFRKQYP